jgi:hypothetical protein
MKCPACAGKGGELEPILWDGIGGGPWYPCKFCKETGTVSIFKMLYWFWISWRA